MWTAAGAQKHTRRFLWNQIRRLRIFRGNRLKIMEKAEEADPDFNPFEMASASITSSHSQFEEFAPSTSTSGRSYDVFINHRGVDVKHTLATTLYKMLTNGMGLRVFLDSEELELGDSLPKELIEAMKSASLHIAIFSKNYAQSRWCLDELSFMFRTGTKIIPIFYYIDIGDVRYAKGVYAKAFDLHEKKGRYTSEKLQEWKDALFNVSHNIAHIVNSKEDEDMLLKSITYSVVKEVKKLPFVVAEHPVGLDEIVKDFELTISESISSYDNVQIVGIWGMGGSGKTTLAKKLYNDRYPSMEKSSLILDVRDAANNNLLHKKQKKLLKDLGFKSVSVDNIEEGKAILASNLRSIRALIVLDDVDHVDQLNALLPAKDSLGSESLIGSGTFIIITTRELEVLRSWNISAKYKMKPLTKFHAKELFCWHAFLQPFSRDEFKDLVEKILETCNGLPLSLKVLGAQLYGNWSKDHWETQLEKISRIVPIDIKNRLKISYDALDNEEKEAFLDIACFFIGEESNLAIEVWNGSGWSGLYNWERLRNKCLVEIDENNFIRMHDHLRDLAREIANEQSPYHLWFLEQTIKVYNEQNEISMGGIMAALAGVLNKCFSFIVNKEDQNEISMGGIMAALAGVLNKCFSFIVNNEDQKRIGIRGIMATSLRTKWDFYNSLPAEDLGESSHTELMVNTSSGIWTLAPSTLGLKIIVAQGCNLNHVVSEVSRDLVWLRWFDIGQTNLQSLIPFKNLRVLELYEDWTRTNHLLRELWVAEGDAPMRLRVLVISGCLEFQGFPKSIGYLKHLKKIVLDSTAMMMNMESLPEELCLLQSLEHLDLIMCGELSSLPNSMGNLRNLRHLNLRLCRKLGRLPDSCKELMLLQHLELTGCSNITFGVDIRENMSNLEFLSFSKCDQIEELPHHIINQVSLKSLYLEEMKRLKEVPTKIGQLSKLQKLVIGGNSLTSLPVSLGDLSSSRDLHIEGCGMLECLPDSIGCLNLLERLYITYSEVKSLPQSLNQLINLETLWIFHCPVNKLYLGAGSSRYSLWKLKQIHLRDSGLTKISISEDCCPGLETLMLEDNDHLTEIQVLPSTVRKLEIIECPKLSALPSFEKMHSLREFELRGCYQVREIEGLHHCRELEVLKAYTWWEMRRIQSVERMERLKTLHIRAMRKPVVQSCIQSIQKWPGEIIVCTPAVQNAASLLHSAFADLYVVDSCSNMKIGQWPELLRKQPCYGNAIIVCFVINCLIPRLALAILDGKLNYTSYMEVEEGKWVWLGVFTQRSKWQASNCYKIRLLGEATVEKGLFVMGEEHRIVKAFCDLSAHLSP
ncbi:disease resistance protein RPV1-like [Cryptomeria japonica]|uniref:disease resistance protein RPV1-like n=1 Tax=Cryptomeria japonica TaxID=3369 RepID=UPI0027DA245B|nr:disease resistance protein RPV1-like [Cryptomeria japonica]